MNTTKRILVTGGSGYLGRLLVLQLEAEGKDHIVSMDIRPPDEKDRREGVIYVEADIRDKAALRQCIQEQKINCVVHLAAIVNPTKNQDRAFLHAVEVEGTRNLLEACVEEKVTRFIVTSSGAAYGYHKDNPEWINESDAIRGNYAFPYSHHKRLVEEMLLDFRQKHPDLEQTIFRVGTILGATTKNQITALFERDKIPKVRKAESPFVFIWDEDMVNILHRSIYSTKFGIYNVAGDGAVPMSEIASIQGKKLLELPAWLFRTVFFFLKLFGASPYGPEQVIFLQYRPVLLNSKLKTTFGYIPQLSSRQVFEYYLMHRDK